MILSVRERMDGTRSPGGYGWPDVAMEAMFFARTEPLQFAVMIALLLVFVGFIAIVAYIFMPKTARGLMRQFMNKRLAAQNAQPPQLPLGKDDEAS
jgi:hypothetical protein